MAKSINPLVAFSDHAAQIVERTASSIVGVHGGGRLSASGIHWRSGVIVTAEVFFVDILVPACSPCGAGADPTTRSLRAAGAAFSS